MSAMNTFETKPERFFNNTFEVGRREDFEVNDHYCYFDYSHEEILGAVLCGREVAVGTLVADHELSDGVDGPRIELREAAVIVDPRIGVWIVAKMFDGFDFEAWDRAKSFRDDVLAELDSEAIQGGIPLWVAAVVLGAERDGLVIPDAHLDVVFGEDEVTRVYEKLSAQHRSDEEVASELCRRLLEISVFMDAKDASDLREIPSWLDERLG